MQLQITLGAASVLALVFVVLSVLVVPARRTTKISLGDGGGSVARGQDPASLPLLVAVRRQGSFAEYVPISLLLIGLLEGRGANRALVLALAGALVLARILHALGISRPAPNPLRGGGVALQLLVLLIGGASGLWLMLAQ